MSPVFFLLTHMPISDAPLATEDRRFSHFCAWRDLISFDVLRLEMAELRQIFSPAFRSSMYDAVQRG